MGTPRWRDTTFSWCELSVWLDSWSRCGRWRSLVRQFSVSGLHIFGLSSRRVNFVMFWKTLVLNSLSLFLIIIISIDVWWRSNTILGFNFAIRLRTVWKHQNSYRGNNTKWAYFGHFFHRLRLVESFNKRTVLYWQAFQIAKASTLKTLRWIYLAKTNKSDSSSLLPPP